MKALAVFPKQQETRSIDHEEPQASGPDSVLIQMLEVGICGTDKEICSFEYGMPPHAGWGLGTERTIMIFTGMENIRECILFPRDRKRLVP